MLLLLFLAHLVTNDGSAAPVTLPLAPRSSDDFCDDINYRRLFDICIRTFLPPDQSWPALFWRRLKMMLIGIIAPEVMVGFAARQFWVAGILSKKYGFSRTHGYFFCMGGFVSSRGYPVATEEQLDDSKFGPEFLKAIRSVDTEDISDKSKGDALSNGVALVQGLWFTAQCLARVHQHLTVTELEVATLAFAVVNVFIWLLWWDKPLDVQRPMVVGPPKSLDARPITLAQISRLDRFLYAINGSYRGDSYVPVSSTSVPSFYSPPMDGELRFFATMGITALAGSVFAAIHCAAWNTDFPTTAEMWIWRSGSLIITVMPVVIFLTSFLGGSLDAAAFVKRKLGYAIYIISGIMCLGSFLIYIVARLILITLPFAALRSLPSSAFMDVHWSMYIPHI
ncbi:hypothetical protein MVEN_01292400 [Mycena venus]|uniref:Uncharacterized protein n=1 Tax=Mycena venus TaxID=2733690 RepID=A0A8H7CVQ0_9AGAR|nr:hypothetical protein MVEN_01292400 [Mycena venus]